MKDELYRKIMTQFAALRTKIYSYLIAYSDENDKAKRHKQLCQKKKKKKLKFEDCKHCLEATHLRNKTNHLEKNKLYVVSLQENHEEFIKSNRLMLKSQQIFGSKKHNEEVNKTALRINDDKKIQSIDSTETYTYGTNEEKIH